MLFFFHTKSDWEDDTDDKKNRFTRQHFQGRKNEANETNFRGFNGDARIRLRSSNIKGRVDRE